MKDENRKPRFDEIKPAEGAKAYKTKRRTRENRQTAEFLADVFYYGHDAARRGNNRLAVYPFVRDKRGKVTRRESNLFTVAYFRGWIGDARPSQAFYYPEPLGWTFSDYAEKLLKRVEKAGGELVWIDRETGLEM